MTYLSLSLPLPCYPDNQSRYAFGAEGAFVLLQPMYSFAIHDIREDTPHTNWDHPVSWGRERGGDDEEMFGMRKCLGWWTQRKNLKSDSQGMGSENKCPVLSGDDEHLHPGIWKHSSFTVLLDTPTIIPGRCLFCQLLTIFSTVDLCTHYTHIIQTQSKDYLGQ